MPPSRPGKPDDHAASGAFKGEAVLHGATSSAGGWRGQRRRDGQPCPIAQEPFIHRKKSLPGLSQKNACKWNYFTEALEYAFAGMCSRRPPAESSSQNAFPLQIA